MPLVVQEDQVPEEVVVETQGHIALLKVLLVVQAQEVVVELAKQVEI